MTENFILLTIYTIEFAKYSNVTTVYHKTPNGLSISYGETPKQQAYSNESSLNPGTDSAPPGIQGQKPKSTI
jgi:hypothetical protein